MIERQSVKALPSGRIVGVIAAPADLDRALRMRRPPDFFELRLDQLANVLDKLKRKLSILVARRRETASLIITARHPREGGGNNLSTERRRKLLMQFLPWASYVDVELRSAPALKEVLRMARRRNVRLIISLHDFKSTPALRSLHAMANKAKSYCADVFKVTTRTDNLDQLGRLIDFLKTADVDPAISAMGAGKLGAKSRILLARTGSILNYAWLVEPQIEGQLSVARLRSALRR